MEGNGISLADIASVTKDHDHDGAFGSDGLWIFALLILLFGGNGGFGFGNNGLAQTDLNLLNAIQNGQRDISSDVQRTAYENMATTKDSSYNNLSEIRDVQASVATNGANIINALTAMQANQQNCCCETKSMILENRYLNAQNTAAINANTTEQTQKVLDAISQNKVEALQSRISELELANAMSNVPRINPYGYGISQNFCGCYNNNI